MSVKYAECTIANVRQDLGITASGNMTDQKFREKSGQLTGSVSLQEYKGNVCGQHLTLDQGTWNNPNVWNPKKDESSAFWYLSNIGGRAYIGGGSNDRWLCQVTPASNDIGSEIRGVGTVSENGNFRLTGKCYGRFSGTYPEAVRLDVNIISNASGYLQGAQDLLWNFTKTGSGGGNREITINEVVPLSTSKPYVTLIVRAIGLGGYISGQAYTHEFWDLQLKRVS